MKKLIYALLCSALSIGCFKHRHLLTILAICPKRI